MKLRTRVLAALALVALYAVVRLITRSSAQPVVKNDLSVGTFNLWNIMFLWEVRRPAIADMIRGANVDVVVLQEVRASGDGASSQVHELQYYLPEYQWSVFVPSTDVSDGHEGSAILSRFPIISNHSADITATRPSPDANRRVAIIAEVFHPVAGLVKIVSAHLSYDKPAQCENVLKLYKALSETAPIPTVIAGDLNMYAGDDDPLALLSGLVEEHNRCRALYSDVTHNEGLIFQDAWSAIESAAGLTFSNMPTPGLVSRPDRILSTSKWLQVAQSTLIHKSDYGVVYYPAMLLARAIRIIANRDCGFDCGPRGKCVCGVCVLGAEANCEVPCRRCEHVVAKTGLLVLAIVVVVIALRRRLLWLIVGLFATWIVFYFATLEQERSIWLTQLPEELNVGDHLFLVSRFNRL